MLGQIMRNMMRIDDNFNEHCKVSHGQLFHHVSSFTLSYFECPTCSMAAQALLSQSGPGLRRPPLRPFADATNPPHRCASWLPLSTFFLPKLKIWETTDVRLILALTILTIQLGYKNLTHTIPYPRVPCNLRTSLAQIF